MITTVYFARHAESDRLIRDGRIRPLTEKGLSDRGLVTDFLLDKNIDAVLSSPFRCAVETVADFAGKTGLAVLTEEDFREQKSSGDFPSGAEGFDAFLERQWADFSYKLSDGESLAEVQERNIAALNRALAKYPGKNILIGTHGTALSTIINYYDKSYGFGDFTAMVNIMPWVVKIVFDGYDCVDIQKIDIRKP